MPNKSMNPLSASIIEFDLDSRNVLDHNEHNALLTFVE